MHLLSEYSIPVNSYFTPSTQKVYTHIIENYMNVDKFKKYTYHTKPT